MIRFVKVSLAAAVMTLLMADRPAEACGLKLTVKGTKSAKAVEPSPNPSRILLVGEPSRRLEKNLASAGHVVEVSDDVQKVRSKDYAVVLVDDPSEAQAAQSAWPNAHVLAMSRNADRGQIAVERALERTMTGRTVIAARDARTPIAAGPDDPTAKRSSSEGSLVGSGTEGAVAAPSPREDTVPTAVAPAPVVAAAAATAPPKSQPVVDAPKEPVAKAAPVAVAKAEPAPKAEPTSKVKAEPVIADREEDRPPREKQGGALAARATPPEQPRDASGGKTIQATFPVNSDQLGSRAEAMLANQIAWLKKNPSARVRLEGHTDSTGPSEYNLALSERRANAAKAFLTENGIAASRIDVVGYGEEQPVHEPAENPRNRCVVVQRLE